MLPFFFCLRYQWRLQVPRGARSLSAILNEYVFLKEQQIELLNERSRVQALFKGLQEIVNVYQSVSNGVSVEGSQLNAIAACLPPYASALSQQIGKMKMTMFLKFESESILISIICRYG